ncbi:MAG: hypothetical protein SOT08_00810 [Candidatus Borkfalkiaceae bacterium]|nr:hypothetical protein [Christensenellaceae bacterium]
MKTKKLSMALLTAIAAITFALAGLFAFGAGNGVRVKADEGTPAEITLVTAGWATNSSKTVSFKACTWEGTLPTGNYYGNIYVGGNAHKISVFIQDVSGATGNNVVFYIKDYTDISNPVDFENAISSFTVKKGETFSKEDDSVSFTFATDYTVACNWDGTPAVIVRLVNVTLSSGGWSEPTTNLARVLHGKDGNLANGKYYGEVYDEFGKSLLSGIYIDFTDNNLRFYVPDMSVTAIVVKQGAEFVKSDDSQVIVFSQDYLVTFRWGNSPVVSDVVAPAVLSLGTGRWSTSTNNGNPQYTVNFNATTWDGTLIQGWYYGNIYDMNGKVYAGAYFEIPTPESGADANSMFTFVNVANPEKITEFVVKSSDVFKKSDGTYPFFFDKDYIITVNWDGVPTVREDLRTIVTLSDGVSSDESAKTVTAAVSATDGLAPSGAYTGNAYAVSGATVQNVSFEIAADGGSLVITFADDAVTDFVVKAGVPYKGADGRELYFDKDYRISLSWGEQPVVREDDRIFVALSTDDAVSDGSELSVTAAATLDGSVISAKAYTGSVVGKNGEKLDVSAYVTASDGVTVKFVLGSDSLDFFAIRTSDKLTDEDGKELYFYKDYTVSFVWGETAAIAVVGATEHVWSAEKTHEAADCSEDGYKYKECIIHGDVEITEELPKVHAYGEVLTEDSTCTKIGRTYKKCSVCGQEENLSVIEKKAHTPSDWLTDVEATAEAEGSAHTECTVCGETLETKVLPKIEKSGCSGGAFVPAVIPLALAAAAVAVIGRKKRKND